MSSSALTIAGVGEFAAITKILEQSRLTVPDGLVDPFVVGPGDDSCVVDINGNDLVSSVDLYIENVHFRTDWSAPMEIGRRCVAAALADVVAMGATPHAILLGLALPGATEMTWVREFAAGLAHETNQAGAAIAGGDLSSAPQIVISITALGRLPKVSEGQPSTGALVRSGAKPGDQLAINGRLGFASVGLKILQRGMRSPRLFVNAFRYPEVDYTAGVRARSGSARSMIDISDGLVSDLSHIARASGVTINIDSQRLPREPELLATASAFGADPIEWILTGGDDHCFAATFPAGIDLPQGFTRIGGVTEIQEAPVLVDGAVFTKEGGFSHFTT